MGEDDEGPQTMEESMLDEQRIQSSIDGHLKRNWEILKHLREKGVGLKNPLKTEHHFMAPRQLEAGKLAMTLHDRGFNILEMIPAETRDGHEGWAVEGAIEMTVEAAADPATAEELVKLAATFDAIYEGWGAEVE